MTPQSREDYVKVRDKYDPRKGKAGKCTLLIVAESPPKSGGYFYNEQGRDSLYTETMKAFDIWSTAATRQDQLRLFQDRGCFLLDVTYEKVDKKKRRDREAALLSGIPEFLTKVRELDPEKIIIAKKTIYAMVRGALIGAGLDSKVLNRGPIAFPSQSRQPEYRRAMKRLIAV